jgi:hypothetical protein
LKDASLSIKSFNDLPGVIEKATKLMGLDHETGYGKRAFSRDILKIEVLGPDRPQLTLVDLPGLIHSENKSQTKEDIALISELVQDFIKNPRSIVLPIVSAKNDLANQVILQRAKEADKDGTRTLGIITKPDELHEGSQNEDAFIQLAQNNDVEFALGWHVLKNRGFKEMESSFAKRNESEIQFFDQGRWRELSHDQLGIDALRLRLSQLLFDHIKREMPSLRNDLEHVYQNNIGRLEQLGEARSSLSQQRIYLSHRSNRFRDLTRAALTGHYQGEFFKGSNATIARLYAVVQEHNIIFARLLRENGHKYHMLHRPRDSIPKIVQEVITETSGRRVPLGQTTMSKEQALIWAKGIMVRNRGTELPGSFNPALIGDLFQIQSQNWGALAEAHLDLISGFCKSFCHELLNYLCSGQSLRYLKSVVDEGLEARHVAATTELQKLLQDEQEPPATYNHYYTTTIQKNRKRKLISAQASAEKRQITDGTNSLPTQSSLFSTQQPVFPNLSNGSPFGGKSSNNTNQRPLQLNTGTTQNAQSQTQPVYPFSQENAADDLAAASDSDVGEIILDMDEVSCTEALDSLHAYYKVALKTFTDNCVRQVINRHLLRGMEDVFNPDEAAGWDESKVRMAAAEPMNITTLRAQLEARKASLERGRIVLRNSCL